MYKLRLGFCVSHFINHALVSLTEAIKISLDNRKFDCGMFIDLQKVCHEFDTVNHNILLMKLEHYGIREGNLDWFRSYLSDRKQYVSVNGSNSQLSQCCLWCSSGFCPWSLRFLMYINALPHSSSRVNFHLFANDTNIYYESNNFDSNLESLMPYTIMKLNKQIVFAKFSIHF